MFCSFLFLDLYDSSSDNIGIMKIINTILFEEKINTKYKNKVFLNWDS